MSRSVKALSTVALVQVSDSCAVAGAKAASSSPAEKDIAGRSLICKRAGPTRDGLRGQQYSSGRWAVPSPLLMRAKPRVPT